MVGLSSFSRAPSSSSFFSSFVFIAGAISQAYAANDWNTPCFDGVCQYSLTSAAGQNGSGTVQIWGSPNAISDITAAAGWQILNCSSTAMAQDIRLVCMGGQGNDTASTGCAHLFQNDGAEGKLVRLPESCGAMPFARVAKSWVPDDQSVPASVAARFVRRDNGTGTGNGTQPQVHALSLDANFSSVDTSKTGNVNIAIRGANFPGADVNGTLVPTTGSRRRTRLSDRGLFDFVGDAIDSLSKLDNFNVNKSINLPPVNVDKSATLLNKDLKCGKVDLNLNVGVEGKADAQASVGVAASGTIIPPKLSDFAAIVGECLNADIDGSLDVTAGVSTTFDTGKIEIFTVGIPGLDFPGILTIGPSFDVNAQAVAELDLAVDMNVGLVYKVENAQLVFPDKNKKSGGSFNIGDTPLTLSVTPSVKATGSVSAHLIPSINLGVSALDDLASAKVFLDLDASATLKLSLEAEDTESVTVDKNSTSSVASSSTLSKSTAAASSTAAKSTASSKSNSTSVLSSSLASSAVSSNPSAVLSSTAAQSTASSNPSAVFSTASSNSPSVISSSAATSSVSVKAKRTAPSAQATSVAQAISLAKNQSANATSSASASNASASDSKSSGVSVSTNSTGVLFGGCVEIDAGFSVNAGAEGSFFDIFNDNTQVPLFSKDFTLFKKCFGDAPSSRKRAVPFMGRETLSRKVHQRALNLSNLSCPVGDAAAAPAPITDAKVVASSIKAAA